MYETWSLLRHNVRLEPMNMKGIKVDKMFERWEEGQRNIKGTDGQKRRPFTSRPPSPTPSVGDR